jgi:Rod binding domain-containing protein
MTSALPPIDQAALPAEVRNGTKQDKKDYEAALSFERMLLGELTKSLVDTAQPAGSDDGSGDSSGDTSTDGVDTSGQPQDASTSMYMQMLPDQLADAVTSAGGLGLAQSFYHTLKGQA